jgi:DHA2 family multidrug resistance protein
MPSCVPSSPAIRLSRPIDMDSASHPPRAMLLATIFLLNGTEFLHAGMIAFGAIAIMGQIGASPEDFVLATVLYAACAIAAIAAQHWLVERLGWRGYVQLSTALFVAGAAICSTSQTLGPFLLGRAVMAGGGAGFMTAARLLINMIPPSPARMKGFAAFAIALALGNAFAPWIAASAFDADRAVVVFALPAATAVLAALLAQACLPQDLVPDKARSQGSAGLMASMLCASLLVLYGLQRAAFDLYADALPLLVCVAVGVAAMAWIVRHQLRQERPLIAFAQLKQRRYLAGLGLFTFCYLILGANNAMLPVLLQRGLGASWQSAGMVQSAGLLSAVFGFAAAIAWRKRSPSPRKFYVVGFAFLFYYAWRLAGLTAQASLWRDVFPAVAAFGVFLLFVMLTTAIHTFSELEHDPVAFNHGQMLKNMMSQLGVALGVAGSTVLMQWRLGEHSTQLVARFHGGDAAFVALRERLGASIGQPEAIAQLGQLLNQQASLLAGADYFLLLMAAAVLAALVMIAQRVFR